MEDILFDDERVHGSYRKPRSRLSGRISHVADENAATGILKAPIQRGDSRTMVKGKRQSERKSNSILIRDLDAAIALLSRVRALASSDNTNTKAEKPTSTGKTAKRTLSTEAREAIAAAQRKRWAKVRRQKKQARRAAVAK
jgi:hypothetical protein